MSSYFNNCIHGVNLTQEYCDQGQCHQWTKANRPDLLPDAYKPKLTPGSGPIEPGVKATEWNRLADVRPMHGQLVEYRGGKSDRKVYTTIDPKSKGNTFDDLNNTIKQGYFNGDCGTHWTESLLSFSEGQWPHLGKKTLPDPDITFWRAVEEKYG